MASRRRGSPRHALLGEPGQPRPVRFGAWLRLFLLGHGRDLLSWPISCLLVGVVVVIPWGMAERQAYLTAAELSQAGHTSSAVACEARYGRGAELAIRVTIPEAPDLVTLIYPTIGPVLDLAPIPWEVCGDPYTTPFDVVVLTRPDGQVSAMATRDLPDSQLLMMWPWIVGIGIALISAAPVWALWAWHLLRRPEP